MTKESNKNPSWLSPWPRKFVTKALTVKGWSEIGPLYEKLEEAPVDTTEELAQWLLDWSEVQAIIGEFATNRYVNMTCHTDDEAAKNAYLEVVREVMPKVTEKENRLDEKFLASPAKSSLPVDEYERLVAMVEVSKELFAENNIPLKVKLGELAQKYQEITGAMTVDFEGEEKTMQQMGVFLQENDCDLRERAYRATYERRIVDKDKLDDIFDEMMKLRHQVAINLGLSDFMAYSFRDKLRDYTPEDCQKFHSAIEKTAVPLARKISERRKKEMALPGIAPWDAACDPLGRNPLKPFAKTEELTDGVSDIFHKVDKRFGDYFDSIVYSMDLESRIGKAPGGYQTTFDEQRIPFIFTNAVGLQGDVNTLLHEGGHAFHTLQSRSQPLFWYRSAGMEFSEVASMSMELIGGKRLHAFYDNEEERKRAWREKIESSVELFGWVAQVDAFQSFLYTNPDHTRKERSKKWLELSERFNPGVDWSGVPQVVRAHQWHRQLHIFEVPFYYVEYAIAEMGALQVYRNYLNKGQVAVDDYLAALALGGSRKPSVLFEKAGIRFDFSEELLGELMAMAQDELGL